jgi:hypothetical protein
MTISPVFSPKREQIRSRMINGMVPAILAFIAGRPDLKFRVRLVS